MEQRVKTIWALLAGPPAAGKSTLARALARHLDRCCVLDKDRVRAALFPAPMTDYTTAQDALCLKAMIEAAAYMTRNHLADYILFDGRTFSRSAQVEEVISAAEQAGADWRILHLTCSDEVAAARLRAPDPDHPAANRDAALYRRVKAAFEPITREKLDLNTSSGIRSGPAAGARLAEALATQCLRTIYCSRMPEKTSGKSPVTLCIDVGGTGLKIMLLDPQGKPLTERLRTPTPEEPTPARILAELDKLKAQVPAFDRVAAGFPGVIKRGIVYTAANLHPKWVEFNLQAELEKRWKKPVRVANDAAVQGYAAIQGKGVEMILTLGTGLGSAIYTDGHLCPGLELAHHPWKGDKTYEDFLGKRGLKKQGTKRWNKLLAKAIGQTASTFNWDRLYLGGGNAREIDFKLDKNITVISNQDGLLGGVALWEHNP